jgi:phage shock protein E
MGVFDFLGLGSKADSIQEFVAKGAVIVDVRSESEFSSGHIKGSKNIPLNTLESKIKEIKKWDKPIIACCLSGMRSAQATSILKQHQITVINGGGWQSLKNKL